MTKQLQSLYITDLVLIICILSRKRKLHKQRHLQIVATPSGRCRPPLAVKAINHVYQINMRISLLRLYITPRPHYTIFILRTSKCSILPKNVKNCSNKIMFDRTESLQCLSLNKIPDGCFGDIRRFETEQVLSGIQQTQFDCLQSFIL